MGGPVLGADMRPLVSYYGGKQRMSSKIVSLLPRHTVYVEPFCGGAAVMFAKPWPPATNAHHYREVINDIDQRLVNLYRVVRDPVLGPEFVRQVQGTLYSRAEHSRMLEIVRGYTWGSRVDRAVAYYIAVMQSFANKPCGGWGTGVFGRNLAATWANKVSGLPDYLDRMLSVHIECDDAIKVIDRWDSPQTLFYCDPPYPETAQGHYQGYTQQDFAALCDKLDSCQGSFVLSGYANDAARDAWQRVEFTAHCTSDGHGKAGADRDKSKKATDLGGRKRTEVVWYKDRSDNARPEAQAIWKAWAANGFRWGGTAGNPLGLQQLTIDSALTGGKATRKAI